MLGRIECGIMRPVNGWGAAGPGPTEKEEHKMLAINMDDVMNVLGMIKNHLIVLGILARWPLPPWRPVEKWPETKNS